MNRVILSIALGASAPHRALSTSHTIVAEPVDDIAGVSVGRKDGIENRLDATVGDNQRQALAIGFEHWQAKRRAESEVGVAQRREGEVQPLCHLLLILGALRTEAVKRQRPTL